MHPVYLNNIIHTDITVSLSLNSVVVFLGVVPSSKQQFSERLLNHNLLTRRMISIILIESENPGNIGAVARAMMNFGLKELVLANPKANPLDQESRNRAKHAQIVLRKAKVVDITFLKTFDYLVATTGTLGTDYNISRSPLHPEQLAEKLSSINTAKTKIGIVFGRESTGLSNKEIALCDFVVTIPTTKSYPILNLATSVAIICYELFKTSRQKKVSSHYHPSTKKEKEVIMKRIDHILGQMSFATKEKKETQRKIWKRILGKSFLTRREAFALIGFLKKLEK